MSTSDPALGMPKQRSGTVTKKEKITWTAVHRSCKIRDYNYKTRVRSCVLKICSHILVIPCKHETPGSLYGNDSVTWLCGGRTAAAKCDLLQLWGRVDGHNHRPKFQGLFNQKLRIGVHYKNFFFTIVAMVRSVEPFMVVYGSWLPAP